MKKTIVGAVCLSLCLLTASCAPNSATAPSSGTEESASAAAAMTSAKQTEASADTSVETTASQTQQTNVSDSVQFSEMPSEFVFSSGAGGWATTLTIRPDGTFDGIYSDSDYMEMYFSTFDGRFGQPRKTGDHTYVVKIEDFRVTNDQDKVFYEEGVEYIPANPYGMDNTDELILYVPGMPISEMPEDCRSWLIYYEKENSALADGDYVLYNAQEGDAFLGLH